VQALGGLDSPGSDLRGSSDETTTDWRDGFGSLSFGESEELERLVEASRAETGAGLATRQQDTLEELARLDEENHEP